MTHEYSACDFTYLEGGGRDECFDLPDECDDDEDEDRSEDDYERWRLEQDERDED